MTFIQNISELVKQRYEPDTILLQGHDVTLTFNVATQMLRVHIVHIATYSRIKFHALSLERWVPPTTRDNSVQPPLKERLHKIIHVLALLCYNHTESL